MNEPPLLETRDLGRRFGRLDVLTGLDLRVETGEVLGVIGPNGAGKSTLLAVLGGTVPVTAGRVLYAGEDVTRRTAHWRARHGIATSYQIPRPFLGMTVFENLLVAATFAGGSRGRTAQERATEALELAHLGAHANDDAASLRLLDRKRLEVARALAAEPRLLLLDEIAGGLTEHEVPELVEIVRRVSAGGVTIIWIEHVVHALTAVATRMLCLSYGTVLAEGSPAEVLAAPNVRSVYLGLDPEAA
jgi:branched-chain amino acid transport system ATP-binding protein